MPVSNVMMEITSRVTVVPRVVIWKEAAARATAVLLPLRHLPHLLLHL